MPSYTVTVKKYLNDRGNLNRVYECYFIIQDIFCFVFNDYKLLIFIKFSTRINVVTVERTNV